MVDKECIYLFHWSHSFDKNTKRLIKLQLQDGCKVIFQQYKNAKSLAGVDSHYALIRSKWLSFGAIFEACSTSLTIGLAFGIFKSNNGEVSWSL